jgi:hypothetical protein
LEIRPEIVKIPLQFENRVFRLEDLQQLSEMASVHGITLSSLTLSKINFKLPNSKQPELRQVFDKWLNNQIEVIIKKDA